MGQFIGSTTVEVNGEDIDINDDERLRAVLREGTRKLLAPMPPVTAKNVLLDTVTDIQMVTTKFAFIINQAMLQESRGIGMETCHQIYDHLATLSGMSMKQDTAPPILGADGTPITDAEIIAPEPPPIPDLNLDALPQD